MSRVSQLMGKPIQIELSDGTWDIHPLKTKHLDLFDKMEDPSKKVEAIKEMVKITLLMTEPEMTDGEIEEICFADLMKIQEAIMKVNGLDKENAAPNKIKERLAQIKK